MDEFKSIKDWASDERPREKLKQKGVASLSNAELLAILINTGMANRSALDIARDLLAQSQQNLLELGKFSLHDLQGMKGMGEKKAITLLASFEIGKRRQASVALERPVISSSTDAFNLLNQYFLDQVVEVFYAIYLNNANRVLHIEGLSIGGVTATVVDSRVVLKRAVTLNGVTGIILAHNHPSGNLQPSDQDRRLTTRIREAAALFDVKLFDHLIIAGNRFYSFADEGIL
jgi:DNA repair protein RadC